MMSCAEWLQGPHVQKSSNGYVQNVVANEVQYLDLLLLMVYSLEVGLVVHVVGWRGGGGYVGNYMQDKHELIVCGNPVIIILW